MFMINPFAELSASIPPNVMQGYLILMVILVAGSTRLDMIYKKIAKYFFDNVQKSNTSPKPTIVGGEKIGLAV